MNYSDRSDYRAKSSRFPFPEGLVICEPVNAARPFSGHHESLDAFHLEQKSGNFGENFREFLYGKKLFHFYACVEVRVA